MAKLTRREFLGIAGTTAGALVAGKKVVSALEKEPIGKTKNYREEWVPSCCNMCGGQCGILVRVIDGKVVKIEPNPHNPNNFSNNSNDFFKNYLKEGGGGICPKGNAGIATLYDPDRVKTPLKRTNPKKGIGVDPKFVPISWDEAYDEIVSRLKKLRDSGEAHKLIWFSEDHSFTHIQQDFCKLYGTPNYSMHSNLCDVVRKAAFKIMMGDERPLCDFINSKYILLFGWNPLAAIKWGYLSRVIPRAIENGAKLVVVDPYLSATAAKAHEWIPIRPSTDGAMALAMGNVIIREKLYDEEFIKEWTVGFEKYAEYVKDKTPEWAEKITTVPAKTIERIAIEFATTKPAVVDVWSGAQHSNGVYTVWAIGLLGALTGQIEKPGTLVLPDRKGNKHVEVHPDEIAEKTLKEKRIDFGKDKYPYFDKSGVYTEIFRNIAEGKGPYQPKIAMIIFQNVLMSTPGPEIVAEALSKLEFVVVVDIFLSETAQFADIVIPGTTYLERYDLNTHWVTWPVLGLRQPVVKPLFGQPAEYEFICELGRRLGLKEKDGKEFFWVGAMSGERISDKTKWYEEYLSRELKEGEPKITLEELKKLPGAVWVSEKGTEYEKHKKIIPPEKLKGTIIENNIIYSTKDGKKDKQIGFLKDGVPVRGFFTPSGKIQFYAEEHKEKKDANGEPLLCLPEYRPRKWQPDEKYPLYLINWKEASHTHTRTQNNPYLLELKSENSLIINTHTARKLGIKDGDIVWVESPYGKVKAKAKLTEGIHPEVVGLQHGFGHWALGKLAKDRGTCDSFLRPTVSCPISGQALHKECCVRIYKA